MANSVTPSTNRSASDTILIGLLVKYATLMELQLLDLKSQVRQFVDQMNAAIMKLDTSVTEEGVQANNLYESVYEESQKESQLMNDRAAARVDDLLAEALKDAGANSGVSADLLSSMNSKNASSETSTLTSDATEKEAHDEVWSKISKKLESVTRLEERLRPHVFKIIECLNFEDIQSQKLEHIVFGYKMLNNHTSRYLAEGQHMDEANIRAFANDFLVQVRKSYSTEEERRIFDQVFKSK